MRTEVTICQTVFYVHAAKELLKPTQTQTASHPFGYPAILFLKPQLTETVTSGAAHNTLCVLFVCFLFPKQWYNNLQQYIGRYGWGTQTRA